jgi:hypothetical protein
MISSMTVPGPSFQALTMARAIDFAGIMREAGTPLPFHEGVKVAPGKIPVT